MSNLHRLQRASTAKHFQKGLFFGINPALTINNVTTFQAGSAFKFIKITDDSRLSYLQSHISIDMNSVVIETYTELPWSIKSKVQLDPHRILQVKDFIVVDEIVSRISKITKYVVSLG